jgi:hypothetical protein
MLLASLLIPRVILAQTASLRGRVTDERGGVIPAARVILNGPAGLVRTATTDGTGRYEFVDLPPADYIVQASAPKLALLKPVKIALKPGDQNLDLQLKVNLAGESVTVQENALKVSIDAANNASARVLSGDDLKALADNPDDLRADLQALAGASAGPGGSTILIDGFSGGQLPSKDSIREIRINSNPFSPEYDRLGLGRIEIFTKPGTDRFRGSVYDNFADSFWNSRNPYAQEKAPFLLKEYGGNLAGPINKQSSFYVDVRRDSIDNGAIINAITLDPDTLAIINPFTAVPRIPQRRVNVSPRVDYQLNAKNTLTLRYTFSRTDIRDAGLGSFNLASRGYHSESRNQTLQLTETALLSATVVNETRFQFIHGSSDSLANSFSPSLNVLGSFNGGGAQLGHSFDKRNSYEFQNYTSILRSKHFWKFGVRLRAEAVDSSSPQNFGGTYTFGGGTAPVLDAGNRPVLDSTGQAVLVPITSIERYRRTLLFQGLGYSSNQIRVLGGGATQFTINAGDPALSGSQVDLGAFVSDDWRVRPNLTLNVGLRYETQTNIHDWRDFAPRIGFAWAPRATTKNPRPKTVLRAGFGVFYDRFNLSNTLSALRYNGIVQQQYVITNPDFFPAIPPISSLAGYQTIQSIRRVSPTLRAPYLMQSAVSIERELPANVTVAITYANTHGLHQLRSENINAPLAGTYDPNLPSSGVFPLGSPGPDFLMESSGLYNQNQLIVNVNSRFNRNLSLSGSYTFNHAMSNTDGLGTFPAKPYDFTGEYGPAATDAHHHVSLSGSINTKWNVRFSPFLTVDSGPPFDITVGRDLYGTTLFNGRPGIATDPNKPGLIMTSYGLLDPNPTLDEKILPRNYGRGPGAILFNLTVAKTFTFGEQRAGAAAPASGPGGPGGPGGGPGRGSGGVFSSGGGQGSAAPSTNRRYSLSILMSVRNVLNHNNPGPIIGNITSPLFGQANQPAGSGGVGGFSEAANNRRLELQMRFNF